MFVHLAVRQILILFGMAVAFSRTLSDLPEINVLDDYYSFCPYNNFCVKNATNVSTVVTKKTSRNYLNISSCRCCTQDCATYLKNSNCCIFMYLVIDKLLSHLKNLDSKALYNDNTLSFECQVFLRDLL